MLIIYSLFEIPFKKKNDTACGYKSNSADDNAATDGDRNLRSYVVPVRHVRHAVFNEQK